MSAAQARYELRDSHHPTARGARYSSLDRAVRDWERSLPPGRFFIYDRETRRPVEMRNR